MITTTTVERVYPAGTVIGLDLQPINPTKNITKTITVLNGPKEELRQYFKRKILPFDLQVRTQKQAKDEYPFNMEVEKYPIDRQLDNPSKTADEKYCMMLFMQFLKVENDVLECKLLSEYFKITE